MTRDDIPTALRRPAQSVAQLRPRIFESCRSAISREIQHLPAAGMHIAHVATVYDAFFVLGVLGLYRRLGRGEAMHALKRLLERIECDDDITLEKLMQP